MSSSTAPGEVRELLRLGAALAGFIALQVIAHRAALASGSGGAVLAPLLLPGAIAVWLGFRRGTRHALGVLTVLAGLAGAALLQDTVAHLLPLLSQLAVCLAIAWLFGHTLAPGAVPLVTQMARAVHGALPPRIEAYTRHVTLAWALYMLGLCVLSVLLFAYAPLQVWSAFANLLLLPLVVLMFLVEYAYRTVRYSWFSHATLAQSVRAFQHLRAARRGGSAGFEPGPR